MDNKYIPAGFIRRLCAFIVDGIILSSITGIILKINPELLLVVSFAYFILMDASKNQGTFGKQLLGIKIINEKGERISYIHAIIRHILKYFGILFFGIGYIGLLLKITHKHALVDTLSHSIVVKNS